MGGAVRPAVPEFEEHLSVRCPPQAMRRDGWAQGVSADGLEPVAATFLNADGGVEVKAVLMRVTGSPSRSVNLFGCVAAPADAAARPRAERDAALHRGGCHPGQDRLGLGPRVFWLAVVGVVSQPATDHPADPRHDGGQDISDVRGITVRKGMKHHPLVAGREASVHHHRVQVDVQIDGPAEPLENDDPTAARVDDASLTCPMAEKAQDRAHGYGDDLSAHVMIPGQGVPQAVGRESTHWRTGTSGKTVIDQMGGPVGHPAPTAARTQRARLAGEGDQPLPAARGTSKPSEAASEKATAQEVAELPLDETGDALAVPPLGGLREEGLEVVAHDLVEHARPRLTRRIGRRRGGHTRTGVESMPRGATPENWAGLTQLCV